MKNLKLSLILEINNNDLIFFVAEGDEENFLKSIYKQSVPIEGFENSRISDLEKFFKLIKDNILIIENKFNFIFKEIILILENLNPQFINISGFKKLNGSKVLRENITYILNTSKSYIEEIESKKNILHIFNSNFYLDKKKIENLPIGLFGDFYSHELSFILINSNDYKNLENILKKCNLKIKKVLLKSFVKGALYSNEKKNTDTFFYIMINENNSKIFYFENNSLKFEQDFKFGSDIIIKDISKITSLKTETTKKILNVIEFKGEFFNEELIDKNFFSEEVYKKIKKNLVYEIALSRIKEISEIILHKNINLQYFKKQKIFLEINDKLKSQSLIKILEEVFSLNKKINTEVLETPSDEKMFETINKLVHFGWKKEAIPVSFVKKSFITKFFEGLFG